MSVQKGIHKSGHRCVQTHMAAKCKIFMNCSKNFIGFAKTNVTVKNRNALGIIDLKE